MMCVSLIIADTSFHKNWYSATLVIRTPLATALMLAYRISEIVQITEVLSFLTGYMVPSL